MKGNATNAIFLFLAVTVLLPAIMHAGHFGEISEDEDAAISSKKEAIMMPRLMIHRKPDTLEIAGSSLPDCSHACGSCRPCRLVMVSYVCSTIEEAETCPMAYKCMCRTKSFPVP